MRLWYLYNIRLLFCTAISITPSSANLFQIDMHWYFKKKFLIIKAKYLLVVEPYYMDDSTPDQLTYFVDEPECQRSYKSQQPFY